MSRQSTRFRPRVNQRKTSLLPAAPAMPANEKALARQFAGVILKFSRGEIAQASHRSKEAAKHWKEGRFAPNLWSALQMAQTLPEVRGYLLAMVGATDPSFMQSQIMPVVMAALYQVAHQGGPDGDAVRAMLSGMNGISSPLGGVEAAGANNFTGGETQDLVTGDLFGDEP